ncbi:MAG: SRPBCC family protein [Acidimicrobiia bacterium]|nr:SRPBCC family protein [Acidimicrobiia bacterium]
MPGIRTSTTIAATTEEVWDALADISTHVEWMADAESIRFTSTRRSGVGTTFDCATKVGPLRLMDEMEITRWDVGRAMGVRHVGLVTGSGLFSLAPSGPEATVLTWTEELRFPWWLGGSIGAWAARPVLGWIWRGNLRRLTQRVEGARPPQ